MAILNEISVGDIFYYIVDDIPTHTASKGSISIVNNDVYDSSLMYINNNGGTVWLKIIERFYGSNSLDNGTTLTDPDGTQVLGSWYVYSNDVWTAGATSGFIFTGGSTYSIYYNEDTPIRALSSQSSTLRAGASKWVSWECGVSLNLTVPNRWNEGFGRDNAGTTTIQSTRLLEMSKGDRVIPGVSPISRESSGAIATRQYIAKYCQMTVEKLDEAIVSSIFTETFESNSFSNWTVVNDSQNVWVVGTADKNSGTYSAYISNNGGTSATYTITNGEVSHFYRDFTFESGWDKVSLTFDWKCLGENAAGASQYDFGAVVIAATTSTPLAGTELLTAQATAGGNGRIGASTNLGKFNTGYGTTPGTTWNTENINLTSYIGQTKRIVFTWVNDTVAGGQPPMIIDNIRIVYIKW